MSMGTLSMGTLLFDTQIQQKPCILNEFYVRLKHIAFILCSNIVSFTKLQLVELIDFLLSKSILSTATRLSAFFILILSFFLVFCLPYIIFIYLIYIFVNRYFKFFLIKFKIFSLLYI